MNYRVLTQGTDRDQPKAAFICAVRVSADTPEEAATKRLDQLLPAARNRATALLVISDDDISTPTYVYTVIPAPRVVVLVGGES
jgi:hypothetical protein